MKLTSLLILEGAFFSTIPTFEKNLPHSNIAKYWIGPASDAFKIRTSTMFAKIFRCATGKPFFKSRDSGFQFRYPFNCLLQGLPFCMGLQRLLQRTSRLLE